MIAQTANPTITPAGRAVASRMADFIRSHAGAHGGITREDLLRSFTDEQIDAFFPAAKAKVLESDLRADGIGELLDAMQDAEPCRTIRQ